jgi:hypothetical protein
VELTRRMRAKAACLLKAVGRRRYGGSERQTVIRHAQCLIVMAGTTTILLRSFLTSGIPAGTDSLGFIARAYQNAHGGLSSTWDPTGFGSSRTFSLEQLLGVVTLLTQNPVVTYKLTAFALVFASGAFTYSLAWRWYKSHAAGVLAGILYATSPIALAQWASGHLNVEVALMMLPVQLLIWDSALERFQLRLSLGLGISFALLLLDRPDMVILSAATLAGYFVCILISRRGSRSVWRNGAITFGVTGLSVLCLDAYQLLPAILGVRSGWLSGRTLFDAHQLIDHSLRAYQSLAGFSQETGYLGYSDLPSSFGHPWLPYGAYVAVALFLPGLALLALAWRCDVRTASLVCLGAAATFLAKGTRPPLGSLYAIALHTLPLLRNSRAPNRWIVVQALAFSILAAISILHVVEAVRLRRFPRWAGWIPRSAACSLPVLVLLPVMPVLVAGLSTYRLTPGQQVLLSTVRANGGDFMVASAPYAQPYRFIEQGNYRGYEHDLGFESPVFTGHRSVGVGDWNPQVARFLAYTRELLDRGDPSFARLLGANNVRYLLAFEYPAVAQSYTTNAIGLPNLAPDPSADVKRTKSMPGLSPLLSTADGTVLTVPSYSPVISARTNIATIVGGDSGLAALASAPGIDISRWAPITAGDALDNGGLPALARVIAGSKLVYVADTTIDDVALPAVRPIARLNGLLSAAAKSSGPGSLARAGQLITAEDDDASIRAAASSVAFRATEEQPAEVWARVQLSATPATLRVTLDKERHSTFLPLSSGASGFQWARLWSGTIGRGVHRLVLTSGASDFGSYANVTQAIMVGSAERRRSENDVRRLLAGSSSKLAYSFDPAVEGTAMAPATVAQHAVTVPGDARQFWGLTPGTRVRTADDGTFDDASGVSVDSSGRRSFFTLAAHYYTTPQDWSRQSYLLIEFHGRAAGQHFEAHVFESDSDQQATFAFVDDQPGWRTIAVRIPRATTTESEALDWSQIGAIKIASRSKSDPVSFRLGSVRLATNPPTQPVDFEVAPVKVSRRVSLSSAAGGCTGSQHAESVAPSSRYVHVEVPARWMESRCRVLVREIDTVREAPPAPLRVRRSGNNKYEVSFATTQPSVLTFSRSFDPRWRLTTRTAVPRHLPVFALVNGYMVAAGSYSGTLEFTGDHVVAFGMAVSLAAIALVIPLVIMRQRGKKSFSSAGIAVERGGRTRRRSRRIVGRPAVQFMWAVPACLLLVGIAAAIAGHGHAGHGHAGHGHAGQIALWTAAFVMPVSWRVYLGVSVAALLEVAATTATGMYGAADTLAVVVALSLVRIGLQVLASNAHEKVTMTSSAQTMPSTDISADGAPHSTSSRVRQL